MNKFALKVSAAAVMVLVGSAAFAGVNVTSGSPVIVGGTLASEYIYNAGGVAPKGGAIQKTGGQTSFITKIGFGVSAGQTRFVRINLVGATFATPAVAGNGETTGDVTGLVAAGGGVFNSNITVVSGGNVGDSTVTYQLTSGNGDTQATVLTINLPTLNVTNGNASPVTASYGLYNDAPDSVSQTGALNPNTTPVNLLTFGKALNFSLTTNTNTASVAAQYRTFTGAVTPQIAAIGTISFGTATTVAANNTAVAITDLISDAVVTVSGGQLTGNGTLTNATALFLGNAACTLVTPLTVNAGKTGGVTAIGVAANAGFGTIVRNATNGTLCYDVGVGNTAAIPVQTLSAALSVTPLTGVNAVGQTAAPIGSIIRDGTQLQSPFYQTNAGNVSRFILTNTSGVVANWTAQVYPDAAQTFTPGTLTGTIPANGFVIIPASSLGTYSTTSGRGFVVFTVDRVRTDIQGVFNYQNVTSGSTSNTVLVAPGTN